MGIKDLNSLIKSECPTVMRPIKLKDLIGLRLAVDISCFLHKYMCVCGDPGWIRPMLILLCSLKKFRISPVIIFDGPDYPPEKKKEIEKRKEDLNKAQIRMENAIKFKKEIEKKYLITDEEIPKEVQESVKAIYDRKGTERIDYSQAEDCVVALDGVIERIRKQTSKITSKHIKICMEILDVLGMPYIQANGEAETLCSYLAVIDRSVDGVISEDSDILAYGVPITISKFDGSTESAVMILKEELLRGFALDETQFRDLCIMCSCDYNERCKRLSKNNKYIGIGPKTAYRLILEYRNIENIKANETIDIEPLKYVRCRELLKPPRIYPGAIKPTFKKLNKKDLESVIEKYNVRGISIKWIKSLYKPTKMEIEEE